MIFEICEEISTFLFILIVAIVAYAQITITIMSTDDINDNFRNSYVLALGELGDFGNFTGF